jgi:hypothetical protein
MIYRFACALVLALLSAPAAAQPFSFVAIGDMPYILPGDFARFERLIGEINRRAPAFTLHIGDIKGGSTVCSDEIFEKNVEYFRSFEQPLIYTPGDNEWTDCHRANNGSFDPLERLEKLRVLFFPTDRSWGKKTLPLIQQGKPFVENVRWTYNNVAFVTAHVVGSNNNLQRDRAALEEYLARNAANLAWLSQSFAAARAENRAALVLGIQANPHFERHPDQRTGFNDFNAALEKEAIAFGRPVLLVHGDTHIFRIDQPLVSGAGANRRKVENVFRLEVYGEFDIHAVTVGVDPADPVSPFSFRPLLVKENFRTN